MNAWSYVLTAVGLAGFWLAGRKVWWCWYVNIANQALWAIYAVSTRQWGFLIGTAFYLYVFVGNAVRWTREHFTVRNACERMHPGESCQPGINHGGANR